MITVYHGSPNRGITQFNTKTNEGKISTVFGSEKVARHGAFFTPDRDVAIGFAGDSGRLYKVGLNIKNPFDMRSGVSEKMEQDFEKAGGSTKWLYNHREPWEIFDGEDGEHFINTLKKAGYDSAIIREQSPHSGKMHDSFVAFHPEQISHHMEESYQGQHSAPDPESGSPLHDLTANGTYPDDIYSSQAGRMYSAGEHYDHKAIGIIQSLRNRPKASVKIYRAVPYTPTNAERIGEYASHKAYILKHGKVPPGVAWGGSSSSYYDHVDEQMKKLADAPEVSSPKIKINHGDWVTTTKEYAHDHGMSNLGGKGKFKILSKTVQANEVYSDGDSIHEFGYHPNKTKTLNEFLIEAKVGNYAKVDAIIPDDVHETIASIDGDHIDPEDLHATLIYSVGTLHDNSAIQNFLDRNTKSHFSGTVTHVTKFDALPKDGKRDEGKCTLVMEIDSPELVELHKKLKTLGLTHTYDEFRPHVSLIYGADREEVEPKLDELNQKLVGKQITFTDPTAEELK